MIRIKDLLIRLKIWFNRPDEIISISDFIVLGRYTLIRLRILKYLQYMTKNRFLKSLEKKKNLKSPDGFDLMTYSFLVNALTHCTRLLGTCNNIW